MRAVRAEDDVQTLLLYVLMSSRFRNTRSVPCLAQNKDENVLAADSYVARFVA